MARFANVSCSNCGRDFGPGDHGYSHCFQHWSAEQALASVVDHARELALLSEEVSGGYHEGGLTIADVRIDALDTAIRRFAAVCAIRFGHSAESLSGLHEALITRMAVNAAAGIEDVEPAREAA